MSNKWIFKQECEHYHGTEDLYYALTNGYIVPKRIIEDHEQVRLLEEAVAAIESFLDQAEAAGIIGEEMCDKCLDRKEEA